VCFLQFNSTAISDALKARHKLGKGPNKCLMTYFVSTNENFGPPHKSLKSTESVWSVNRESCGFESMGIVIISRSLVLGQGRQYNTIQ